MASKSRQPNPPPVRTATVQTPGWRWSVVEKWRGLLEQAGEVPWDALDGFAGATLLKDNELRRVCRVRSGDQTIVAKEYLAAGGWRGLKSLLLGACDGTFAAAVDYVAGDLPNSIAIGDLDSDHMPDLVLASDWGNNVSVLLNPSSPTPGDIDGDGDPFDLALLLASWGTCRVLADCPADLNGDGVVGAADLAQLLAGWSPCP